MFWYRGGFELRPVDKQSDGLLLHNGELKWTDLYCFLLDKTENIQKSKLDFKSRMRQNHQGHFHQKMNQLQLLVIQLPGRLFTPLHHCYHQAKQINMTVTTQLETYQLQQGLTTEPRARKFQKKNVRMEETTCTIFTITFWRRTLIAT